MNNLNRGDQKRLLYAQQLQQQQQQQQRYAQAAAMAPQTAQSTGVSVNLFKIRRESRRISIAQRYSILGYIAAGTYGKVYKAASATDPNSQKFYAIKKFKTDSKDSEVTHYTGLSQSATREMSLCREVSHLNISQLVEIVLERKCVFMVFEFAEYDLLQIIHYHSNPNISSIPPPMLKSAMYQIIEGVSFLHENWILHRDLKPANIMVTREGVIKIGDLGLARKFNDQLQSLYAGDKVVVTIWYRSPELILGARHYTPAVDMWSIGCILGEMISLRPLFKGEEAKMDSKKHMPFQENQLLKILEILGTPSLDKWPTLSSYPEYAHMAKFTLFPSNIKAWYDSNGGNDGGCFDVLNKLLEYDPITRMNAQDALNHGWFKKSPKPDPTNIFIGLAPNVKYPRRKIHKDDTDIIGGNSNANAARHIQQQGNLAMQQLQQGRQMQQVRQQQQQNRQQQVQQAQAAAAATAAQQKRNYDMMTNTNQLRGIYDGSKKRTR